jgi:hypothetical protein
MCVSSLQASFGQAAPPSPVRLQPTTSAIAADDAMAPNTLAGAITRVIPAHPVMLPVTQPVPGSLTHSHSLLRLQQGL